MMQPVIKSLVDGVIYTCICTATHLEENGCQEI